MQKPAISESHYRLTIIAFGSLDAISVIILQALISAGISDTATSIALGASTLAIPSLSLCVFLIHDLRWSDARSRYAHKATTIGLTAGLFGTLSTLVAL